MNHTNRITSRSTLVAVLFSVSCAGLPSPPVENTGEMAEESSLPGIDESTKSTVHGNRDNVQKTVQSEKPESDDLPASDRLASDVSNRSTDTKNQTKLPALEKPEGQWLATDDVPAPPVPGSPENVEDEKIGAEGTIPLQSEDQKTQRMERSKPVLPASSISSRKPVDLPEDSAPGSRALLEDVNHKPDLKNNPDVAVARSFPMENHAPVLPEIQDTPVAEVTMSERILDDPGEFTITLEGLGWIFRSDRSSSGSWRFLERDINDDITVFRFMATESGNWNFVFERQDLSSGYSKSVVRNIVIGPDIPRSKNSSFPETRTSDFESRNVAALSAVSNGNLEKAMTIWKIDASRSDEYGKKARASLVKSAIDSGAINPLIIWLPHYLQDHPDQEVLIGALDFLETLAGYEEQNRLILEELVDVDHGTRQAEWYYRLAFLLEQPGKNRDLDRSAMLYQEVMKRWPLGEWQDKSEVRLLWLQRHYFRVR